MLEKWLKSVKKNQENIKDNLGDFLVEQKREATELLTGKQSFAKYRHDASKIFKDYFVPSDDNDNRPKILRPKQLTIIALVLLLMKVGLVAYLFSVYQETAEMAPATVSDILVLTNESRVAAGVPPLELNFALNQAAQNKAEDMVINNYFSHTSPDGRKPWNFVDRSAYQYLLVGENLAMNFLGATDAHAALMASPSHQKNILNPKYTHVGFAVVEGKIDGETTNIMVQMFAYTNDLSFALEPAVEKEPEAAVLPVVEASVPVVEPIVVAAEINTPAAEVLAPTAEIESVQEVSGPNQVEETSQIEEAEVVTLEIVPVVTTADIAATTTEEVEEVFQAVIETEPAPITAIEEPILPTEPTYITTTSEEKVSRAAWFLKFSKYFYVGFLLLLIISLLINIFVRVAIQHKSVIVQAILLIILVVALLLFDFSFMSELKNAASNIVLF